MEENEIVNYVFGDMRIRGRSSVVFSSSVFLFVFLPLALLIYYVLPKKFRNAAMFVSGLIFYSWGEPVYVVLMLFSTMVDYTNGRLIDKHRGTGKAKAALVSSIIINLNLLGVFKYADFVVANINALCGLALPLPELALPIGISFYTFQTMSYTIDIFRGEAKVQKNIVSFGAYVTMFPQLIAGPIVRYKDIDEQLRSREYNTARFAEGVGIFCVGLSKKVLLANSIGQLWDAYGAIAGAELTVAGAWLAVLAYSFQIYFDFSGYSDMAVGLGKMFGFDLPRNFNYPYIARSATEFWRRWHITLGTWFREYLYIPLGGNRKGKARWFLNIFIVWAATGIWHGAAWNFMLWGLFYGAVLVIEKLFLLKRLERLPAFVSHLYLLLTVVIGWALFAPADLARSGELLAAMFGLGQAGFAAAADLYYLRSWLLMFVILILASLPFWKERFLLLSERPRQIITFVLVALSLLLCTAGIVDSTYNPFLYFRF